MTVIDPTFIVIISTFIALLWVAAAILACAWLLVDYCRVLWARFTTRGADQLRKEGYHV
jgi:hypothetical protein